MRSSQIALSCGVLLLALATLPKADAQQTEYGIGKIARYTQTADGVVAPNDPVEFEFAAQASYPGTVSTPAGTVVQLNQATSDGFHETVQTYGSQAAMDAAFPSGVYTFAVQTQGTVQSTLTGDVYPSTPEIVHGYWSNNQLLVDPSHDFFLSFSSFPGYTTAGIAGQVIFQLQSLTGPDPLDKEWDTLNTPVFPGGITIPAGTLSPGSSYSVTLEYGTFTTNDFTTVPGSLIYAVYQRRTVFSIQAVAPPTAGPNILVQPQSQTVAAGSTVVFKVAASGTPAPTYQWYHNLAAIPGSLPTLTLSGVTAADAGNYYCVAANGSGSVGSSAASLTVSQTQDVGRLVNISCRSQVGTGGNIMIAGFVVGGGTGSENLLIRGSGPALNTYSVPGTLADPQLQIFSGQTALASNSGWAGDGAIALAASTVHAFPWTSASSHDSAVLQPLGNGAYTAQISGQSGDTGVALAEVYDDTPSGTFTTASPRLINISARVQVGTGGNILIAGFVIGGSTSRTMLIRASGPALILYGVPGTLADPKLELYSGSNVLATNTGWAGDAAVVAAIQNVHAFAWNDSASADSAILVTLPPGAYTAQVSGASGDTGVALVEVYEVP